MDIPVDEYSSTGSNIKTKLTLNEREVHTLLHYMDSVFQFEDVNEFVKDFTKEDDEHWDIKATKSVYKKILAASNSYFENYTLED